ncbi:MAG: lactate dehydrogenase [Deltaproteobacteria bacterium HGW-Deltaproteobacteria-15]|jgi:LDH2 family malate/lactate/ureidoglycolate dehydrogenase|nr:MAG: lactate dehydrogenase [Deltaproteobacteria bacterium HGW-Deltaproteobacteria-15]
MNDSVRIAFEDLKNFCKQAYEKAGVPEAEADIVADLLVRSDLRGVETHGVTRLPIYIRRLQKGFVRKESSITVIKEKGPTAFLDGHGSMGHLSASRGMEEAIRRAEEYGIGWVSVRDSGHFGVAGLFPMMALKKDFIGYVVSNSAPMMFPWGGKQRIIGNNPLAYAFPADKCLPVVLDFSLSVVSSGKLILCRKKGERIPLGWAVDKEGIPTEDPYEGYEGGGSLAPVGGHKGYGLVLAHEMLTAVLTAGKWTSKIKSLYEEDPFGIQGTCHSFMAIDPDCFIGRKGFKKNMDEYILAIKGSARAKGAAEILVPGEPEHRTEVKFLEQGIPLPPNTARELTGLAETLGIPNPFQGSR